jgi:hypothetical protein
MREQPEWVLPAFNVITCPECIEDLRNEIEESDLYEHSTNAMTRKLWNKLMHMLYGNTEAMEAAELFDMIVPIIHLGLKAVSTIAASKLSNTLATAESPTRIAGRTKVRSSPRIPGGPVGPIVHPRTTTAVGVVSKGGTPDISDANGLVVTGMRLVTTLITKWLNNPELGIQSWTPQGSEIPLKVDLKMDAGEKLMALTKTEGTDSVFADQLVEFLGPLAEGVVSMLTESEVVTIKRTRSGLERISIPTIMGDPDYVGLTDNQQTLVRVHNLRFSIQRYPSSTSRVLHYANLSFSLGQMTQIQTLMALAPVTSPDRKFNLQVALAFETFERAYFAKWGQFPVDRPRQTRSAQGQIWFSKIFGLEVKVLACEADAHNSVMHMTEGNTMKNSYQPLDEEAVKAFMDKMADLWSEPIYLFLRHSLFDEPYDESVKDNVSEEDLVDKPPQQTGRPKPPQGPRPSPGSGGRAPNSKPEGTPLSDPVQSFKKMTAVASRLLAKWKTWGDFLLWLDASDVAPNFAEFVWDLALKEGLHLKDDRDSLERVTVSGLIKGKKRRLLVTTIFQAHNESSEFANSVGFADYCSSVMGGAISAAGRQYYASHVSTSAGDRKLAVAAHYTAQAKGKDRNPRHRRGHDPATKNGRDSVGWGLIMTGIPIPRDHRVRTKASSAAATQDDTTEGCYVEVLACIHNKLMHALNGNTMRWEWPKKMEDVSSSPSVQGLLSSSDGVVEYNPTSQLASLTAVKSNDNALPTGGDSGTVVSGMVQDIAGVEASTTIDSPEGLLWPAVYWRQATNAIADNVRPLIAYLQTQLVGAVYPMTKTELGNEVDRFTYEMQRMQPERRNDLYGWLLIDLAAEMKSQNLRMGDSLLSVAIKARMYAYLYAWTQKQENLPMRTQVGKFSPPTTVDETQVHQYTTDWDYPYHTYGFSCIDGATNDYLFPMVGADHQPSFALHASLKSLEKDRTAIFLRPSVMTACSGLPPSACLAVVMALLSPFPWGFLLLRPWVEEGANVFQGAYFAFANLVQIDGVRDMQFVLPIREYLGLSSLAGVSASAQFAIVAGPQATPNVPAGANYNYLYRDPNGNVIGNEYYAADFLYTWIAGPNSPIKGKHFIQMMHHLNGIFDRPADIMASTDWLPNLAVRYPSMQVSDFDAPIRYEAGDATTRSSGCPTMNLRFPRLGADFPEERQKADFVIPEMSLDWWNAIMTGMWVSPSDRATVNSYYDNQNTMIVYYMQKARLFAATSHLIFQVTGMSVTTWDDALTQMKPGKISSSIRRNFMSPSPDSLVQLGRAEWGPVNRMFYENCTGFRLYRDTTGSTIWDVLTGIDLDICPAYSQGQVAWPEMMPVMLCDFWLNMTIKKQALGVAPWLGLKRQMTGFGKGKQLLKVIERYWSAPLEASSIKSGSVGDEALPVIDDQDIWNNRLLIYFWDHTFRTISGTDVSANYPASDQYVMQRNIAPEITTPNLAIGIYVATTSWLPYCSSDNYRVFPVIDQFTAPGDATQLNNLMAGYTPKNAEVWLVGGVSPLPVDTVGAGGDNTTDFRAAMLSAANASVPPAVVTLLGNDPSSKNEESSPASPTGTGDTKQE